jgi:hypothetical protein
VAIQGGYVYSYRATGIAWASPATLIGHALVAAGTSGVRSAYASAGLLLQGTNGWRLLMVLAPSTTHATITEFIRRQWRVKLATKSLWQKYNRKIRVVTTMTGSSGSEATSVRASDKFDFVLRLLGVYLVLCVVVLPLPSEVAPDMHTVLGTPFGDGLLGSWLFSASVVGLVHAAACVVGPARWYCQSTLSSGHWQLCGAELVHMGSLFGYMMFVSESVGRMLPFVREVFSPI